MLLLQAFMALGNLAEQRLGCYSLCNLNPLPINYWCNDFHLHQWQVEHGLLMAGSKVLLILLAEACDTQDLFPSKLNYEPKFIPALLMAEVMNFAQNTWSPFFQKKTREWVWGHILFHLLSIWSHSCALQKQAFPYAWFYLLPRKASSFLACREGNSALTKHLYTWSKLHLTTTRDRRRYTCFQK